MVYRIEPETVPFDIAPFSGDLFAQQNIKQGRYEFEVIAEDSDRQVGGIDGVRKVDRGYSQKT